MRLIDADALLRSHCSVLDDEYESCGECLKPPYGCCCLEIRGEYVYNAPTIDAIPVEWLRERKHWAAIDGDHWAENIISYLLDAWQKEQEAR